MNRQSEAYQVGVALAIKEAGINSIGQNALYHLLHGFKPALPLGGAALGGTVGALSADEDESALLRALAGAGLGAAGGIGAGGLMSAAGLSQKIKNLNRIAQEARPK